MRREIFNVTPEILDAHLDWVSAAVRVNEEDYLRDMYIDPYSDPVNQGRLNLFDKVVRGNLHATDLRFANFNMCDCRGVDFSGADLRHASFLGADLRDANLSYAYCDSTVFYGADLSGAMLVRTDLHRASLGEAKLPSQIPSIINTMIPQRCPMFGEFMAFMLGLQADGKSKCYIVIKVPADASRSSGTTLKCRCDKATIIDIFSLDGKRIDGPVYSLYDYYRFASRHPTTWQDESTELKPRVPVGNSRYDDRRFMEYGSTLDFFMCREDIDTYYGYWLKSERRN